MIASTRVILPIFSFGFALGLSLSYIFFKTDELKYRMQFINQMQEARLHDRKAHGMEYESVAEANEFMLGYSNGQFIHREGETPVTTTTTTTPEPSKTEDDYTGSGHLKDENQEAIDLSNSVRILCFVLTSPSTHKEKAIHVKRTWGKRCNTLLFITTKADPDLDPVLIVENIHESRSYLWAKTKHALREIYEHYLDEADWFLKADDDTYVVMENLRYMLRSYNPNETHYFGHTFHPKWLPYDYMSGGAGYVLSRRTVERLVEEAFPANSTACRQDYIKGNELSEDVEIGRCINLLKIPSSDSRDVLGRLRFFPFSPNVFIFHSTLNNTDFKWWWQYSKYSTENGLECCSDTAVAFHYVSPQNMYIYEYFLYHLHAFGINRRSEGAELTNPSTEDSIYYPVPDALDQLEVSEKPSLNKSKPTNVTSTSILIKPALNASNKSTLKTVNKNVSVKSTTPIKLKTDTALMPNTQNGKSISPNKNVLKAPKIFHTKVPLTVTPNKLAKKLNSKLKGFKYPEKHHQSS